MTSYSLLWHVFSNFYIMNATECIDLNFMLIPLVMASWISDYLKV